MESLTLKQQLIKELNLTEKDFSSYQSDLYVRKTPKVTEWLREKYEFYSNVTTFFNEVEKELWLEIPFGFMDEHYKATHPNKTKE